MKRFSAIIGIAPLTCGSGWPPLDTKRCEEATDGCTICLRDGRGGLIGCSTPGIACQPKAWVCQPDPNSIGMLDLICVLQQRGQPDALHRC